MNQLQRESVEREIMTAIIADEKANAYYYRVIKSFISCDSANPEARLDSFGLKDIDRAWLKLNITSKSLRRAYMKLYEASLRHV
jgi:hypothetical protein